MATPWIGGRRPVLIRTDGWATRARRAQAPPAGPSRLSRCPDGGRAHRRRSAAPGGAGRGRAPRRVPRRRGTDPRAPPPRLPRADPRPRRARRAADRRRVDARAARHGHGDRPGPGAPVPLGRGARAAPSSASPTRRCEGSGAGPRRLAAERPRRAHDRAPGAASSTAPTRSSGCSRARPRARRTRTRRASSEHLLATLAALARALVRRLARRAPRPPRTPTCSCTAASPSASRRDFARHHDAAHYADALARPRRRARPRAPAADRPDDEGADPRPRDARGGAAAALHRPHGRPGRPPRRLRRPALLLARLQAPLRRAPAGLPRRRRAEKCIDPRGESMGNVAAGRPHCPSMSTTAHPDRAAAPIAARGAAARTRPPDRHRPRPLRRLVPGGARPARAPPRRAAPPSSATATTTSLVLHEEPQARRPRPHRRPLPLRAALPDRARSSPAPRSACRSTRTPIQGASDHGTHEAIYLPDPDGNGIELAADRPREPWPAPEEEFCGGGPRPLDFDALLATVAGEVPAPQVGPGLRMGHLHLHVGDIDAGARLLPRRHRLRGLGEARRGGVRRRPAATTTTSASTSGAARASAPAPAGTVGLRALDGRAARGRRTSRRCARASRPRACRSSPAERGFLVRDPWDLALRVVEAAA